MLEQIVVLKLNDSKIIPTLPKDMQKEKVVPLESEFRPNSRDCIRGLSYEQERILLPDLIGVQPNDVHFAARSREFWADVSYFPTAKGMRLNIATEKKKVKDSSGELVDMDLPVNVEDYITYQIAMQSSKVAKTAWELENKDNYDFFLIDLAEEAKKEEADFNILDKADSLYARLVNETSIEENEEKINWVLELLRDKGESFDVDTATILQKKMLLRKLKDEKAADFIKTVEDPNLSTKALIKKMFNFGVITKEGNEYFDGNINIGGGSAAISWFNKAENSAKRLQLEARLKAAVELKRS